MLPKFIGGIKDYVKLSIKDLSSLSKGTLCPYCHGNEVNQHGAYTRNVRTMTEKICILVKRLLCKACNRTFSLLPCFVLPYQRWDLTVLERLYDPVLKKGTSVNKALMEQSITELIKGVTPSQSALCRQWNKITCISEKTGDNIYTLGKELEPAYDPFSNPDYQSLLDGKGIRMRNLKFGLQWITSAALAQLTALKLKISLSSLPLLHFSCVYPCLFSDSS